MDKLLSELRAIRSNFVEELEKVTEQSDLEK